MIVEEKIPFLEGKKYIVFAPNDIIKCSDSVWLKPNRDEGLDDFDEQYQLIDDVDEKIINEIKILLNL